MLCCVLPSRRKRKGFPPRDCRQEVRTARRVLSSQVLIWLWGTCQTALIEVIMPEERCSATWQCSIHSPGFGKYVRISTVLPVGTSTVSSHARLEFFTPSLESTRKRAPCRWMGCCIG